jgi:ubiquinone/menaquinone biosynthesis C-methylase UbiE
LTELKLLPYKQYRGVNREDPIRFYYWPLLGSLYRKRVELCLSQCTGGERVLEVGFGTGLSFLNLKDVYQEIHGIDLTANIDEVKSVFDPLGIKTYLQNGNVLNMPYPENTFDTVLLISILEHLKPEQQVGAFQEIARVLKPGGQVVYGVPVERGLMVFLFRVMGVNIREHHFSTEKDVYAAARQCLAERNLVSMGLLGPKIGNVYQVGNFAKPPVGGKTS